MHFFDTLKGKFDVTLFVVIVHPKAQKNDCECEFKLFTEEQKKLNLGQIGNLSHQTL